MKELIFEKQDENKTWEYSISEELMTLLLRAPEWANVLKETKVQYMRLYKEYFEELDDNLYTFEVEILMNHQSIKLTKIELLKDSISLDDRERQSYASISVNGKRKNAFLTTEGTWALWEFTHNYFDYSVESTITPFYGINNILEKAIKELELCYINKDNLMTRKHL